MIVNNQKPIEFVNEARAICDYELLEKAMLALTEKPIDRLKKIFMHGKYPAISIHGRKIHIHRLLKCYEINRKFLWREEYVHHKNGNKLDARLENLEIMAESEHQSHHNKGKTLSKEHRRKIGEAGKKRKGMTMKKRVQMPNLQEKIDNGWSINKIAKHYGCDWSTVKSRIYENPKLVGKETV